MFVELRADQILGEFVPIDPLLLVRDCFVLWLFFGNGQALVHGLCIRKEITWTVVFYYLIAFTLDPIFILMTLAYLSIYGLKQMLHLILKVTVLLMYS